MKRLYYHSREYFYIRFPKTAAVMSRHTIYLRYLIAGCTAAGTDISLLYIFTDLFGIWYLSSAILAFLVAFVVSFLLQKFWTFRDNGVDGVHKQAASYLGVQIIGLGLNTLGMYLLVDRVGIWYILAQFIMGMILAVMNFILYRTFIFTNGAD